MDELSFFEMIWYNCLMFTSRVLVATAHLTAVPERATLKVAIQLTRGIEPMIIKLIQVAIDTIKAAVNSIKVVFNLIQVVFKLIQVVFNLIQVVIHLIKEIINSVTVYSQVLII